MAVGERAVDERAARVVQRLPRDRVADRRRQQLAQQRGGVGGRLEGPLEEGIVRASGHGPAS
jgi:hypothetical protein